VLDENKAILRGFLNGGGGQAGAVSAEIA